LNEVFVTTCAHRALANLDVEHKREEQRLWAFQ
jgi:hypothetical protein